MKYWSIFLLLKASYNQNFNIQHHQNVLHTLSRYLIATGSFDFIFHPLFTLTQTVGKDENHNPSKFAHFPKDPSPRVFLSSYVPTVLGFISYVQKCWSSKRLHFRWNIQWKWISSNGIGGVEMRVSLQSPMAPTVAVWMVIYIILCSFCDVCAFNFGGSFNKKASTLVVPNSKFMERSNVNSMTMMPIGLPRVPYRIPGPSHNRAPAEWVDITTRLQRERILFVCDQIDEETANALIAMLLYMDNDNSNLPIYLYVSRYGQLFVEFLMFHLMQTDQQSRWQRNERIIHLRHHASHPQ